MRNVSKGFQFGKMAIPRSHASSINKEFTSLHTPAMKNIRVEKPPRVEKVPTAGRPGRNPGTGRGRP